MPQRYQNPSPDDPPLLAIRRHTDRCFHRVEEVVPGKPPTVIEGYIVDGILIPIHDVAQIIQLDHTGAPLPRCNNTGSQNNKPKQ